MRVVDPNRSRCSSAADTATSCASSSRSSPVSAHHTDNDFGAENVASNPDTARTTRPSARYRSSSSRPSGVPETGSRPDSNNSNDSTSTVPDRPEPGRLTTRPHTRHLTRSRRQVLARSTPPSPPPTTHGGSSPAASTRAPPAPARGHLSASLTGAAEERTSRANTELSLEGAARAARRLRGTRLLDERERTLGELGGLGVGSGELRERTIGFDQIGEPHDSA